jgi:hypothetical protein
MSNNPSQIPMGEYVDYEPPRSNTARTIVLGCLGVLVVAILLMVLLAVWVARNARDWAANLGEQALTGAVGEMELTDEDRAEVQSQIARVADEFRRGDVTVEELGELAEKLATGPVATMGVIRFAMEHYIEPSGLSDEEKEQAKRTLRRFGRGFVEGQLDGADFQEISSPIMVHEGNRHRLKDRDQISDDDLREFLKGCGEKADGAEMPDEPWEFDLGDEVRRVVDQVVGERKDSGTGDASPR